MEGLFTREIKDLGAKDDVGSVALVGDRVRTLAYVKNVDPANIADYDITALNILVKFDTSGLQYNYQWWDKPTQEGFVGKSTVLYAVKADGTAWKDDLEMNHTQDQYLRYYDSWEEAQKHGVIVGVLWELRGKWMSGSQLVKTNTLRVSGMNSEAYAVVQDVKIWQGQYDTSWENTDGEEISQGRDPDHEMFPYDNPNNTDGTESERVYRKDTWPENSTTPLPVEGHTWGETYFVQTGKLTTVRNECVNLNGKNITTYHHWWNEKWSMSTFDPTVGERIVDRVYTFTVSGVGEQALELSASWDMEIYDPSLKNVRQPYGQVFLSTEENPVTYTPNTDPALPGTFVGGTTINPESFTVPGDGTYKIYFQAYLGDSVDLSKDVKNGIWGTSFKIYPEGDTLRYVKNNVGNIAYAVNIQHSGSFGVGKFVDQETVSIEEGTTMSYDISFTTANTTKKDVYLLDVLPYNGDSRGTKFDGNYTLESDITLMITGVEEPATSDAEVYYTTDEDIRTVSDIQSLFENNPGENAPDTFTTEEVTWKKAQKTNNVCAIPKGENPVAILLLCDVAENERVAAKLTMTLEGQKTGNVYVNDCAAWMSDGVYKSNQVSIKVVPNKGTLQIYKKLVGKDGNEVYNFKIESVEYGTVWYMHAAGDSFAYAGNQSNLILPVGQYTVTELYGLNFALEDTTVTVDGVDKLDSNNVQIEIVKDQNVQVVFTNKVSQGNIPTDASAVINGMAIGENGEYTINFHQKKELGQSTKATTSN